MSPESSSNPPRITFAEAAPTLDVVTATVGDAVLVGGQALNFWAERYALKDPALLAAGPFVSADLDFVGGEHPRDARVLAAALAGAFRAPPLHYGRSVIVAQVTYADGAGHHRDVQFLRRMCGMKLEEVIDTAIPFPGGLRVLHPVLCLESRIHNIVDLPQDYDTVPGRQQGRVAALCARHFLLEALDAGHGDQVLRANQRIFRIARDHARRLARLDLHPFSAVISDPRLPDAFNQREYPRMQRAISGALSRRTPDRHDRER